MDTYSVYNILALQDNTVINAFLSYRTHLNIP